MSSLPGYSLESYVMWYHDLIVDGNGSANLSLQLAELMGHNTRRKNISTETFQELLAVYEPYRREVEERLSEFDEESQSWRDYAGYNFDFIPDESRNAAEQLLNNVPASGLSTPLISQRTFMDSAGKLIKHGDKVRFRGQNYTIKEFVPNAGSFGTAEIIFNEPQHTDERADEISVDLIVE